MTLCTVLVVLLSCCWQKVQNHTVPIRERGRIRVKLEFLFLPLFVHSHFHVPDTQRPQNKMWTIKAFVINTLTVLVNSYKNRTVIKQPVHYLTLRRLQVTCLEGSLYQCNLLFLCIFTYLIFVFPCIILYGFYQDQLDANCLVLFLLHYLLYMFRMQYTSILRSDIKCTCRWYR